MSNLDSLELVFMRQRLRESTGITLSLATMMEGFLASARALAAAAEARAAEAPAPALEQPLAIGLAADVDVPEPAEPARAEAAARLAVELGPIRGGQKDEGELAPVRMLHMSRRPPPME